ncbi:MAG: NAD kinase [Burkholderiales bacterium]|nr:MAG: NAD kinase [Burkholderiales bacterium]
MSRPFSCVALVGRHHTAGVGDTLDEIAAFLRARDQEVLFEAETARSIGREETGVPAEGIGERADLAVVVGGDGTMLGIARQMAGFDVPLVGINHGRLGFMTDVPLASWRDALKAILDGQYETGHRTLLSARVMRSHEVVFSALALNDVVVSRGAYGRMVELDVEVDGVFMYTQRADGLIVSTPTGSTAYSLSAAGPILHPNLAGFVIVPVAPQALSNRPIVLPDSSRIMIRVHEAPDSRVNCDMQTFADLQTADEIHIERAPYRIRLLHPVGYSYFATLRKKLSWQLLPQAPER